MVCFVLNKCLFAAIHAAQPVLAVFLVKIGVTVTVAQGLLCHVECRFYGGRLFRLCGAQGFDSTVPLVEICGPGAPERILPFFPVVLKEFIQRGNGRCVAHRELLADTGQDARHLVVSHLQQFAVFQSAQGDGRDPRGLAEFSKAGALFASIEIFGLTRDLGFRSPLTTGDYRL